jgi:hypothetical protein
MDPDIQVFGLMTNNMDLVKKHGRMELYMRVITIWVKNMAKEK